MIFDVGFLSFDKNSFLLIKNQLFDRLNINNLIIPIY